MNENDRVVSWCAPLPSPRTSRGCWDLFCGLPEGHTQGVGNAFCVFRVGFGEMAELTLGYLNRHALHGLGDVVYQPLLRFLADQAEQVAGLPIIVVAVAMVVAGGIAGKLERRLDEAGILHRAIE